MHYAGFIFSVWHQAKQRYGYSGTLDRLGSRLNLLPIILTTFSFLSFSMIRQIAYSIIEEQEGKKRVTDDYISFVGLLADPRYCG